MDEAAARTEARRLLAPEDDALLSARTRSGPADEVPSPEVGALLAWAARSIQAATAVEVGSAAGVSGLWLLEGLTERGVLTSVEPDAHRHGLAVQAYAEARVTGRVRAIEGDPSAVLPRLADGAYDLVLLQAATDPEHLEHALRLARPGGLIALRGTLQEGARTVVRGLVGDTEPSVLERLSETDDLDATLLPIDDGLVLARRMGA